MGAELKGRERIMWRKWTGEGESVQSDGEGGMLMLGELEICGMAMSRGGGNA